MSLWTGIAQIISNSNENRIAFREYLKTENAVAKFEGYIRGWMKQIQELLLESEQLRLETDDAGPQVRIKKYYVFQTNIFMHYTLNILFIGYSSFWFGISKFVKLFLKLMIRLKLWSDFRTLR